MRVVTVRGRVSVAVMVAVRVASEVIVKSTEEMMVVVTWRS